MVSPLSPDPYPTLPHSHTNQPTVASWYDIASASPSEINFLIVASIWTLCIALTYLTIFPKYLPQLCHRYTILAAETVTMVFWLSAFLSTAVFMSRLDFCRGAVCMSARAGVVFAAFEW
jgi:Membrane-associating domain